MSKNFRTGSGWVGRWAGVALLLALPLPAAAVEVSPGDLQAVVRSLGFATSLPRNGTLTVAVVYSPDTPDAKAAAARIAAAFEQTPGPNGANFHAIPVSVAELAQGNARLDAVFIAPGAAGQGALIALSIRRRHLISISNDPACLDTNCCVLMVSVSSRVRIVLNTALADQAGAHFSPVFTMMVERK